MRYSARVENVDVAGDTISRPITALHLRDANGESTIALGPDDYAIVTLGSITADATFGGDDTTTELIVDTRDASWTLWESIARLRRLRQARRVLRADQRDEVEVVHGDDALDSPARDHSSRLWYPAESSTHRFRRIAAQSPAAAAPADGRGARPQPVRSTRPPSLDAISVVAAG